MQKGINSATKNKVYDIEELLRENNHHLTCAYYNSRKISK